MKLSELQKNVTLTRKERRLIDRIIEKYKPKKSKEKSAQESIPYKRIYP